MTRENGHGKGLRARAIPCGRPRGSLAWHRPLRGAEDGRLLMTDHQDEAKRLVDAARKSRIELEKQGTPDYDPREHQRVVEAQRKLTERLHEDDAT